MLYQVNKLIIIYVVILTLYLENIVINRLYHSIRCNLVV